jgi:zinc transporter ZupT
LYVLGGFLLQVFLDFYTKGADHGHYHPEQTPQQRIPISLLAALCIHSFIEGVPIGAGAYHDAGITSSIISGIALHEIPAAFVLVSVLRANHLKNKYIFPFLILYASMSLLGVGVSKYINTFTTFTEESLHNILAIVIGSFLHISTTILFESSENHHFNRRKLAAIIIGIGVGLLNLLVHH